MSLSDCPKCWETPCVCGHQYQESRSALEVLSAVAKAQQSALEKELKAFLKKTYVQQQDPRQAELGLSYTQAETSDLARQIMVFLSNLRPS